MAYATKPLDWVLSDLYLTSVLYLLPLLFLEYECGVFVCACEVCLCISVCVCACEVCMCICVS